MITQEQIQEEIADGRFDDFLGNTVKALREESGKVPDCPNQAEISIEMDEIANKIETIADRIKPKRW